MVVLRPLKRQLHRRSECREVLWYACARMELSANARYLGHDVHPFALLGVEVVEISKVLAIRVA